MKPELTPEDRERIEQEAKKYAKGMSDDPLYPDNTAIFHFIPSAEYATIFERERQAELRTKVIDECIAVIKSMKNGFNYNQIDADDAIQNLNKLTNKP